MTELMGGIVIGVIIGYFIGHDDGQESVLYWTHPGQDNPTDR
jgi:hypothetical protein